jgi:hypothetical protein
VGRLQERRKKIMSNRFDKLRDFLEWDEAGNQWIGMIEKPDGLNIEIYIDSTNAEDVGAIAKAEAVIDAILANEDAIRDHVVASLLNIYNDFWAAKGAELSPAEFRSRIDFVGIIFEESDRITAVFQDNREQATIELFGGHDIFVSVENDGQAGDPYLAG